MTIAQALKEKNKKVATVQTLWARIQKYNSISEGSERPYDIEETYASLKSEIDSLVRIKTAIHSASAPVREDIFRLSELKSTIQQIRMVSTTRGTYRDRFSESALVQTAVFGVDWQDSEIERLEKEIEEIQEKLDHFNHTITIK